MEDFSVNGLELSDIDKKLILLTQEGFEITKRPYLEIANQLNIAEEEVVSRLNKMKEVGFIRKNAVATNHYKLGYKFNAMSVWEINEGSIETVGKIFNDLGFVSHCYERPKLIPVWNYNLFAMVHGKTLAEVQEKVSVMKMKIEGLYKTNNLLFSTEILKKTGIRLKDGKNV